MARRVEETVNEGEDDVIEIGKLRRPKLPGASITYDPGHGIRVEGEDAPPEPRAAAAWLLGCGGWIRFRKGIPKGHPLADDFVRAVRVKNRT